MFNYLGLKLFYFSVITTIVIGILFTLKSLFVPLLISLFIAMMLRPLVTFFESKGFSHSKIIISIYSTFFLSITILFIVIFPIITQQFMEFTNNLPIYINILNERIFDIQNSLVKEFGFTDLGDTIEGFKDSLNQDANGLSAFISSHISNAMSLLTYVMLIPFFAFFMLKDMHLMNKTLLSYVPNKYFEIFVLIFYKTGNSIQLYIRGQLIDASFVGVMTAIGLSIIGFPFALLIGLIAGVGNLVPYFGPILGAIPAILVILVTPEWAATSEIVLVVGVFLVVQAIETVFVYPIAVGNSVNLHPIVIILALLVGAEIAGILGMIIIIPLIAILKVTFELLHRYIGAYKIIRE